MALRLFFGARPGRIAGSFTADAVVLRPGAGSFSADAWVDGTAGLFYADAVKLEPFAGSFTANAWLKTVASGSFTADFFVLKSQGPGGFTADAIVFATMPKPVAFVSSSSISELQNVTFKSVSRGTGFNGDLTLVSVLTKESLTPPTIRITSGTTGVDLGFQEIGAIDYVDGSRGRLFAKTYHTGEPSTYYVSLSTASAINVVIVTYRVASPGSLEVVTSQQGPGAPFDTITTGTLTLVPNSAIAAFFQSRSFGSGAMSTVTGLTELQDRQDFYVQQALDHALTTASTVAPPYTTTITNPDTGETAGRGSFLVLVQPSGQFVANADIKQFGRTGSLTVDAFLTYGGHPTIDAIKLATLGVVNDLVVDSFTRTDGSSWGTADVGGTWDVQSGPAYSTNGSEGQVTPVDANVYWQRVGSSSVGNRKFLFRIKSSSLSSPNFQEIRVILRNRTGTQNSAQGYSISVWFDSASLTDRLVPTVAGSGSARTSSITNGTPNRWKWVRAEIYGLNPTRIRGKIWLDGTAEPSAWLFDDFSDSDATLNASELTLLPAWDSYITARFGATISLDNIRVYIGTLNTFSAESVIRSTLTGSFTADAWFAIGGSFTINAAKVRTVTGSLTANASVSGTVSASTTADAVILPRRFTADASIRISITGSFTANATIVRIVSGSFTADALTGIGGFIYFDATIYGEVQGDGFTAGANIVTEQDLENNLPTGRPPLNLFIRVDGVELTDDVRFAACRFVSSSSGRPGEFELQIIDKQRIYNFVPNMTVTVDLGGQRVFAGYASYVTRGYAFDVDDTTDPAEVERVWTLTGPDINILLLKRIVWDRDEPTTRLRRWDAGTSDKTIIDHAITNYTVCLTEDNLYLDTSHVADPSPDKKFAANAGSPLVDFLGLVARNTGGVYWIAPDGAIRYEDDDTEDAPFRLTDRPDDRSNYVGFSPLTMSMDGTQMINDALIWGAGQGKPTMTFSRTQDSVSRAAHGRWQEAEMRFDAYKQATVNRFADQLVYGSPQNLRGHKDDRRVWRARLFTPGLAVGMKVKMESEVFGVDSVIPIRRLALTFPTPFDPAYEIEMSHELDPAWSFSEFPRVPFPDFEGGGGDDDCPDCGGGGIPEEEGVCEEEVCGIFDSFSRVVASGWGTSDAGVVWSNSTNATTSVSVGVDGGYLSSGPAGTNPDVSVTTFPDYFTDSFDGNVDLLVRFRYKITGGTVGVQRPQFRMVFTGDGNFYSFTIDPSLNVFDMETGGGPVDASTTSPLPYGDSGWMWMRWEAVFGDYQRIKFWDDGDDEPGSWTLEQDTTGLDDFGGNGTFQILIDNQVSVYAQAELWVSQIELNGMSVCGQSFDDFRRTVDEDGAGVSPGGYVWDTFTDSQRHVSVDGTNLVLSWTSSTGGGPEARIATPQAESGPWHEPSWTMTTRVKTPTLPPAGLYRITFDIDTNGKLELRVRATGSGVYNLYEGEVPFTFLGETWYNVRWEFTFDGPERIRVWEDGTAEPSSWLIDVANNGSGSEEYAGAFRVYNTISVSPSQTSEALVSFIDFDYAGRRCYEDCSGIAAGAFDTFDDRTEATEWGTTSQGAYTWRMGGEAVASVSGGIGTIATPDKAFGNWVASANIEGQNAPLSGAFTMLAKVRFPSGPTTSVFAMLVYSRPDGVSGNIQFSPRVSGGGISLGSSGAGPADFQEMTFDISAWYWVEWIWPNSATGTSEVRIWEDGDTRPSTATVSKSTFSTDGGTPDNGYFAIWAWQTFPHVVDGWEIDYLDFTTEIVYDSFTRTVVDELGANDNGSPWYVQFVGSPGSGSHGVNGSTIFVDEEPGGSVIGYYNDDDSPLASGDYIMSFRYKNTAWPFGGSGPVTGYWGFRATAAEVEALNSWSTWFAILFSAAADAAAGVNIFQVNAGFSSQYYSLEDLCGVPGTGWVLNTWHTLQLDTRGYVRAWPDGMDEPEWTALPWAFTQRTAGRFFLAMQSPEGSAYFDDLRFTYGVTSQCVDVEPTTTPGMLYPGSLLCETATMVDSTHYTVTNVISFSTSEVTVDGVLYARGIDYTEDHQTIVFTLPVIGDEVYVCYRTLGG